MFHTAWSMLTSSQAPLSGAPRTQQHGGLKISLSLHSQGSSSCIQLSRTDTNVVCLKGRGSQTVGRRSQQLLT